MCAFVGPNFPNDFAGFKAVVRSRSEDQPWPRIEPAQERAREKGECARRWSSRGNDENARVLCSAVVVRLGGQKGGEGGYCIQGSGEADAALTLVRKSVSGHVARIQRHHGRLKRCRGCQSPTSRVGWVLWESGKPERRGKKKSADWPRSR